MKLVTSVDELNECSYIVTYNKLTKTSRFFISLEQFSSFSSMTKKKFLNVFRGDITRFWVKPDFSTRLIDLQCMLVYDILERKNKFMVLSNGTGVVGIDGTYVATCVDNSSLNVSTIYKIDV